MASKYTQRQLSEYSRYKTNHIKHHNECRMCRSPSIESNLYIGYRECIACKNNKGEGYPFETKKPKTIEQYFNNK